MISANFFSADLTLIFLSLTILLFYFLKNTRHLLKTLLLLEAMGLTAITVFTAVTNSDLCNPYLLFVFFSFLVAEAVAGLGALIAYSRKCGSNLMNL